VTTSATWPSSCRRVVIVAPCVPEASGGARAVENYVPMFEALGAHVDVVSLYPGIAGRPVGFVLRVVIRRRALHRGPVVRGGSAAWRRAWLLPVVAFKRLDWALAMWRYRRLMSSFGRDTLVLFTHVTPLAVLHESGFTWAPTGPLVIGQHHAPFVSVEEDPGLGRRIAREFAGVDAFVALTGDDATRFAEVLRVPCYALPNPARPLSAVEEAAIDHGGARPRTAVALARLSPVKQLDLMIRAFVRATTAPGLQDWRLRIFGEGSERAALERVIDAAGAGDRVELMGEVDDVGPALDASAVNLLTSRYEGFGMSALEAAQRGVPTVAFDCSVGVGTLVTELHGRLVRPAGDEDAFVDALRTVLVDEVRLAESGALARVASGRYHPDEVGRQWARVVADLLERRSGR
jgi:glycosyltransferase involved in cell wall biosynthesis